MNIKKLNETLKAEIKETIFDDEEREQVIDFVSKLDYEALRNHFLQSVNPEVDYVNLFELLEGLNKEEAETYIHEFYVDNYDSLEDVEQALDTIPEAR